MKIFDLRIRNFRGIRAANIRFGNHTVLLGPNGSGKTSIIEALAFLLGRDRMVRSLTEHDFYGSAPQPADRISIVATVFGFDADNPDLYPSWFRMDRAVPKWLNVETGELLPHRREQPLRLACQIAVSARFDHRSLEVEAVRYFHDDDNVVDAFAEEARIGIPVALIRDIGFFLVPANRAWDKVMSFSSELFRRVVASAHGTPAAAVMLERDRLRRPQNPLEADAQLQPLVEHVNREMARYFPAAPTLHLRLTPTDSEGVLDAVTAHYRYGENGTSLPARRHGSGLISLQWLLLLLQFGRQRADAGEGFWMALEEPELHVPPPLQRRLVRRIQALSTQTLVSTHSPTVAAMAEPSSLMLIRNADGVLEALSLARTTPDVNTPNQVRRLFEISRAETVGALMHEVVLVPEGRWDWEWLRLLVRAVDVCQTWRDETDCYFDARVGIVPTNDAAVVLTYQALESIHPSVSCLVDGDPDGMRYVGGLRALARPPRVILRWPNEWSLEDIVGWILLGRSEEALAQVIQVEQFHGCADVPTVVERLKSSQRERQGCKGDLMAYEALVECLSRDRGCMDRSRRLLNGLADALTGDMAGVLAFSPQTGQFELLR